ITIEEQDGSLMMNIQQWDAGFKPRTPAAQKMELTEIGDKRVKFKAVTEGPMTTLGYSLGADGSFNIEAGQPGGNVAKLALKKKEDRSPGLRSVRFGVPALGADRPPQRPADQHRAEPAGDGFGGGRDGPAQHEAAAADGRADG